MWQGLEQTGAVCGAVLQKALLTEQMNASLTSAGLQPPK